MLTAIKYFLFKYNRNWFKLSNTAALLKEKWRTNISCQDFLFKILNKIKRAVSIILNFKH